MVSGIAGRGLRAGRSRSRSARGPVLSVWGRSIAAALRYRSCTLLAGMRKAAGGLQLVAGLAARWGWRQHGERTVTWFELRHPISERDITWANRSTHGDSHRPA